MGVFCSQGLSALQRAISIKMSNLGERTESEISAVSMQAVSRGMLQHQELLGEV